MSTKLLMLAIAPLMLSVTSCAANTTEPVRTVSDFCLLAKPITFARQHPGLIEDSTNKYDTTQTSTEVEQHDLVYERICGKK